MARGIGSVPVHRGGNNSPRVDELIDIFRLPAQQWTTLRFIPPNEGNELLTAVHWIERYKDDGSKAKFSKYCLGFDLESGNVNPDNCPYCINIAAPKIEYFYNVIVRELQENEPARQPNWTASENETWYKEKNSKSWTPVRVIRLTPSVVEKIQKFISLKGAEPDSIEKGYDISIYFDPKAKAAADMYQVQCGDVTPLQDYEWNSEYNMCAYLVHEIASAQPQVDSWERAEQEVERILPNLVVPEKQEKGGGSRGGKGARRQDDDDGYGDGSEGYGGGDMDAGGDDDYSAPARPSKGAKGGKGARPAADDGYGEDGGDAFSSRPTKGAKGGKGGRPAADDDDDFSAPAKPAKGGKGARPAAHDDDDFAAPAKPAKGGKGARPAADDDGDDGFTSRPTKGAKGTKGGKGGRFSDLDD